MIEIRSYRRVFDLERRIYRVDRLRLNPGGIPVRGVVYFLAILAASLLTARLPLVSLAAGSLPWYLRDLALPGVSAALLAVIRIEGRPFHLAAHALVRYISASRRLTALCPRRTRSGLLPGECWRPPTILMLPDGSDPRMRRLSYRGPGAVLIAVSHGRESRGRLLGSMGRPRLVLRQTPGAPPPASGAVIVLERAVRLRVR